MSQFIYHVVLPSYWKRINNDEAYMAPAFEEEGFIHCCTAEQIDYVLTTYFVGIKQILLLKIDTNQLTSKLIMEPANGQYFPHVYGPINRASIIKIETINQ